jgi:ribokinase
MIHEYPDPKPPLERTGAGDAFSATFTVAIAQGKSIREALMWGPINSMSVVQQVGARAGLLRPQDFTDYLVKAPKDYPPVRL